MTDTSTTRTTTRSTTLLIGLTAVIVVLVGGVGVWTVTCPCNQTPGFILLGDVQTAPVTDWGFVNDIPLCQIQDAKRPEAWGTFHLRSATD